MFNLIKGELLKLRYGKNYRNLIIIIGVCIFLTIILSIVAPNFNLHLFYNFTPERNYGFTFNIFKDNLNPMGVEYFKSAMGLMIIVLIISLSLVGDLVAKDYQRGVNKDSISYGHNRINIYIAKSITIYIGITILITLLLGGSTIVGSILKGFGVEFNIQIVLSMVKFALLLSLVMLSFASIFMVIAIITKSKSNVIAIGMFFIMLTTFIAGEKNLFIFNKNNPIYMLMDICEQNPSIETVKYMILSCITTITLCTIIGSLTFKNQDIK